MIETLELSAANAYDWYFDNMHRVKSLRLKLKGGRTWYDGIEEYSLARLHPIQLYREINGVVRVVSDDTILIIEAVLEDR